MFHTAPIGLDDWFEIIAIGFIIVLGIAIFAMGWFVVDVVGLAGVNGSVQTVANYSGTGVVSWLAIVLVCLLSVIIWGLGDSILKD